ncbi:MAG: stage V sporulation protein AC [Defluviitaleaceae bacterium]|nr:stage V sporulation protein AC [Defluviitaleaceae bacterium]
METSKSQAVQDYEKLVREISPKSAVLYNSVKAFFVGGTICAAAQLLYNFFEGRGFSRDDTGLLVAAVLIAAAVLLTALRIYDRLAKFAGAGTIVPITGFANSIAAPAIEHKKEGMILGLGAKMFVIAGPVIVYGTVTSVIVGLIYYFMK